MKKSICLLLFAFALIIPAQAQRLSPTRQLAYDIFKQLIEINTTDSVGNCTEAADAIRQTLVKVINDNRISITPIKEPKPSPPSPLRPDVMSAIERVTSELWPGVPVAPTMSTGATDSLYLRKAGIALYGTSGIFGDLDDSRAHGKDERIAVKSFFAGQEYLYRLVKAFTTSQRQAAK